MDTPKYGKQSDKKVIDKNGSTVKEEQTYVAGSVMYPVRREYEVRYLCDTNDTETLARIAQSLIDDTSKLDTSIIIDKRPLLKGETRYYIVECYTKLIY